MNSFKRISSTSALLTLLFGTAVQLTAMQPPKKADLVNDLTATQVAAAIGQLPKLELNEYLNKFTCQQLQNIKARQQTVLQEQKATQETIQTENQIPVQQVDKEIQIEHINEVYSLMPQDSAAIDLNLNYVRGVNGFRAKLAQCLNGFAIDTHLDEGSGIWMNTNEKYMVGNNVSESREATQEEAEAIQAFIEEQTEFMKTIKSNLKKPSTSEAEIQEIAKRTKLFEDELNKQQKSMISRLFVASSRTRAIKLAIQSIIDEKKPHSYPVYKNGIRLNTKNK